MASIIYSYLSIEVVYALCMYTWYIFIQLEAEVKRLKNIVNQQEQTINNYKKDQLKMKVGCYKKG